MPAGDFGLHILEVVDAVVGGSWPGIFFDGAAEVGCGSLCELHGRDEDVGGEGLDGGAADDRGEFAESAVDVGEREACIEGSIGEGEGGILDLDLVEGRRGGRVRSGWGVFLGADGEGGDIEGERAGEFDGVAEGAEVWSDGTAEVIIDGDVVTGSGEDPGGIGAGVTGAIEFDTSGSAMEQDIVERGFVWGDENGAGDFVDGPGARGGVDGELTRADDDAVVFGGGGVLLVGIGFLGDVAGIGDIEIGGALGA